MASAGTFLHTGLKLPYYMFFGKDSGIEAKEPPLNMLIAMGMAAFLCIGIVCCRDRCMTFSPIRCTSTRIRATM